MTADEARKVADVVASVDGGCYVCAGKAARSLVRLFPEHDWWALVGQAGGWRDLEASMREFS